MATFEDAILLDWRGRFSMTSPLSEHRPRMKTATSIDEYIAAFPAPVQARLRKMRATIRRAAPGAEEAIAYGVPTYRLNGNLVHFAAFAKHVGFYPAPSAIAAFRKELAKYRSARGSVQFPHDRLLPLSLVAKIVRFRVKENVAKKAMS